MAKFENKIKLSKSCYFGVPGKRHPAVLLVCVSFFFFFNVHHPASYKLQSPTIIQNCRNRAISGCPGSTAGQVGGWRVQLLVLRSPPDFPRIATGVSGQGNRPGCWACACSARGGAAKQHQPHNNTSSAAASQLHKPSSSFIATARPHGNDIETSEHPDQRAPPWVGQSKFKF